MKNESRTLRWQPKAALVVWSAFTAAVAAALTVGCGAFSSSSDDAGVFVPPAEAGADVGSPRDLDGSPAVSDAASDSAPVDAATKLIVFVTASTHKNVTTAAIADDLCMQAAAGVLPGKFRAWFSTPSTGALARLTGLNLDGPWYRPDGPRVVANAAALGNADVIGLENPIRVDPAGNAVLGNAWTGTFANGAPGNLCPSADPTKGDITKTDGQWTRLDAFTASCTDAFRLYCFQVE